VSRWDKVKIKEAFSYVSRGKSPNYTEMSMTRVINQACIYWDGLHLEKVKYQDSTMVNADRYLNNNDVLVNSTGTGTLGRCCVFTSNANDIKYIVDTHVTVLRPSDDICASFFKYFIMRKETQDCLYSKCVNGSTNQIELSKEKLLNFLIPLPPLETQKQISKTLDTAEELLAMRKQQLAELDKLIKSTFCDMFGDPIINAKGWEGSTLGDCCNLIKDGPHVSPNYVEDGIPFVSVNNIIKGYWDLEKVKYITREDYEKFGKRCKPEFGDVLYTKGGTTGYAKYVDRDFEFMNWVHIAVLKYKRELLNGIFLENMLNSDYCYNQAQLYTRGIANRDLVLGQMSRITLFVPPIPLQTQFAAIVTKIEEQKTLVKKAIDETKYLFQSLMSDYFE